MKFDNSKFEKYLHSGWRIAGKEFFGGIWSGLWIVTGVALIVSVLGATIFDNRLSDDVCEGENVIGCLDSVLEEIIENS